MERMENFTAQIEKACEKKCNLVIVGDANLCSEKWNDAGFVNKQECCNNSEEYAGTRRPS